MFKSFFLFFLAFGVFLNAKDFCVASYNVENLFDLENQKTEYKEYKPFTSSNWNKKTFHTKLNNTIKVIKDIDCDIIALQEIENKQILQTLLKKIPSYKYYSFSKYKNSAVGLGFISKVKIINSKDIKVKFSNKTFRPILESTFKIDNHEFKIFNNHWPSKRVKESYRIKFAKKLYDRVKKLPKDYDYILLGDFNSNYNEEQTFKFDKKLNNTYGITGINQVLNTKIKKDFNTYDDLMQKEKIAHYNLWLDLKSYERFSNKFRNKNQTPDNIIVPKALFDTKNISYIPYSFKVFKPSYLYKNKRVLRWQIKKGIHQGYGYSDHLPIIASFSTKKEYKNSLFKHNNQNDSKDNKEVLISYLYEKETLKNPSIIKNAIVIYKNKNNAILKQKNNKAIYFYKNAKNLKLGNSYDFKVTKIENFYGLKEVKEFELLKENKRNNSYKKLYLNAKNIDIFNPTYQNEIITNLNGIVKNNRLYFQNKEIRLYCKDKSILPPNNSKIRILSGHLSTFKGNIQINIHKKSDYKVEF
ncbi:endonuclease/exonuclease/phosphatase family protein [Arcobacter roscoffensis]|uniref:Endonuclease n=1 Tax=Arcobacter roscoffensis TaxID=2961520 RepID=A0ABY5E170_9BACT|nr:endonuclease/exonuclease/phosphatase family protein [Arcobacter roscoffensis]UTJ05617.1 endonuclease [Arcobacter roscoffensis]